MLFHNKLLSNTAGQVNLSVSVNVCAVDQPLGVSEPVMANCMCVCVWVCVRVKVVDLSWWSGLSQQRLDVWTAEHKAAKWERQ